jgi:hypothetical protein
MMRGAPAMSKPGGFLIGDLRFMILPAPGEPAISNHKS